MVFNDSKIFDINRVYTEQYCAIGKFKNLCAVLSLWVLALLYVNDDDACEQFSDENQNSGHETICSTKIPKRKSAYNKYLYKYSSNKI